MDFGATSLEVMEGASWGGVDSEFPVGGLL